MKFIGIKTHEQRISEVLDQKDLLLEANEELIKRGEHFEDIQEKAEEGLQRNQH